MELFPNGIGMYLLGGVLLGVGIAVIYLSTGLIAGASTFLESTLSWLPGGGSGGLFTKHADSRNWRLVFTLGIVSGAALYAVFVQGGGWVTGVAGWRLLVGGVLVGFGARLGKGCTSGNGICGVASLSAPSILNVTTFLLIAIGVASLVQALGASL